MGKILYDRVHWIGNAYMKGLINPLNDNLPGDLIDTSYSGLHTHYLLIVNSDAKMIDRIKQRTIETLGHIAENTDLGTNRNGIFWRVSSQNRIYLPQKEIYRGEWVREPSLHEKKAQAIQTLMEKVGSGEI
jgi:methyl coenzyme M reductase subunit C-like uncharacterized protein (methanogenesis marker protein 7)